MASMADKKYKNIFPAIIISIAIILSLTVFCWLRIQEKIELEKNFIRNSEEIADNVEESIKSKFFILSSICGFYNASDYIERDEFTTTVAPHLSSAPDIEAIAWIPVVDEKNKSTYELLARQEGYENFQIKSNSSLPLEKKYFPIYYVEPFRGNEELLGVDIASTSIIEKALKEACDNNEAVITEPVICTGKKDKKLLIFIPVYERGGITYTLEGRRASLKGFIMGMFNPESLFKNAIYSFKTSAPDIYINIHDITDNNSIEIYTDSDEKNIYHNMICTRVINTGERLLEVKCTASRDFIKKNKTWKSWWALISGLLLTGLLSFYLFINLKRTELIGKIIEEKTHELKEAMKIAKQASIAKSEFLANMSHEIRTPMNGVMGMTSLLMATDMTSEQKNYVETINKSGENLLKIINDILDFSKIEAGKLELEIIDFNLTDIIEDVIDIMAIKAYSKGLELNYIMHPEIKPLLRGDPGKINQILINFIGNAIKFTRQGEITAKVTLEEEKEHSVILKFSVIDTGIGISEESLSLLFKSFSQIDASIKRQFGGTGLGLAISKQLAEMMGGEAGVISKEGRGSTFWFTAIFEKQPYVTSPLSILSKEARKKKILIADKKKINRFIIKEYLNYWKILHDEASTIEEVMEKLHEGLEEKPFDIAIINMEIQKEAGGTIGLTIKENLNFSKMHLILLSPIGNTIDEKHLSKIGFNSSITSPIKGSVLHRCLSTIEKMSRERKKAHPADKNKDKNTDITRKSRILLVEDNPINQKVALTMLKKFNYRADTVPNGKEAVNALKILPYDLILMDIQMPVMDGFEATKAIRNNNNSIINPRIPIIAMTAHAMKGYKEKCIEAGMNDYITKPVHPDELLKVLEKQLGPSSSPEIKSKETALSEISQKYLDWDKFLNRFDGDEEFCKEILGDVLETIPAKVDMLKKSLEQSPGEITVVAHEIKGVFGNINTLSLHNLAAKVEMAGKKGDLQKARLLIYKLSEEVELFKNFLETSILIEEKI